MFYHDENFTRPRSSCKCALKVSISSLVNLGTVNENLLETSKQDSVSAKCVRCGDAMEESKSIFVTIHPPSQHPTFHSTTINTENNNETCCHACGLSNSFHKSEKTDAKCNDTKCNDIKNNNHTKNPGRCHLDIFEDNESIIESDSSCIHSLSNDEFLENQRHISDRTKYNSPTLEHRKYSHQCTDCHIALVLNCSETHCREQISLMLQVPHIPSNIKSAECQTEYSLSLVNVGPGVNILDMYPDVTVCSSQDSDSKENLPGSEGYRDELPELNAENEAAYQSHLKNLVPCSFCGRKFNPDRVMVHENACIKKPKKRKYISLNKDKSK